MRKCSTLTWAHSTTGAHRYRKACRSRGIKVTAPPLLNLRRAGVLSREHQDTRKILNRKKQTDTQYVKKARFDRQRLGNIKVATWNIRENAEKKEELQTELL